MKAALLRAYLRQRIRWAEGDLAWQEATLKHLPAQVALTRGTLSALRTSLAISEPARRDRRDRRTFPSWSGGAMRAAVALGTTAAVLAAWR